MYGGVVRRHTSALVVEVSSFSSFSSFSSVLRLRRARRPPLLPLLPLLSLLPPLFPHLSSAPTWRARMPLHARGKNMSPSSPKSALPPAPPPHPDVVEKAKVRVWIWVL